MTRETEERDRRLLHEISRVTNDYGALQRRTVRDLARSRVELARVHAVIGTVAHDLRSPLAAVLGFIDLLLEEELTPAQREFSERASSAAETMTTLIEELVDAVTIGNTSFRSDPVDLSLVARHVITRHQLLQAPRGVRAVIDRDLSSDAPTVVQGDEAKLERLLENLVSNAVKFSPDGGHVHVSVSHDALTAEIRVRDDGPGLPPEQLEQIFVPFHRAPAAAAVPGIGLGLTIVRQIAARHDGRVHVESTLGAGATFVVRLPRGTARTHTPVDSAGTLAAGPPDRR